MAAPASRSVSGSGSGSVSGSGSRTYSGLGSRPLASDGSTYAPSTASTVSTDPGSIEPMPYGPLEPGETYMMRMQRRLDANTAQETVEGAAAVSRRIAHSVASFSPAVIKNFSDILHFSIASKPDGSTSDAQNVLARLSGQQASINASKGTTRLTDVVYGLTEITTTIPANQPNRTIDRNPNAYNVRLTLNGIGINEDITRIGGGAFGAVFLGSTTGNIYKRVNLEGNSNNVAHLVEEFARETLLEAFIQTVLQNDARYGTNIARLIGLFRDSKNRRNDRAPRLGVPPREDHTQTDLSFFYVMEPAGTNISDIPYPKSYADLQSIHYKILEDLGNILHHFAETYGFKHRDLHSGNVLISNGTQIKIIDFGKACINVQGTTYSVTGSECESFDLLILLVSLLQFSGPWNTYPEARRIMRLFLTHYPTSSKAVDIYVAMLRSQPNAAFWTAYIDKIEGRYMLWDNPINYAFIEDRSYGVTHLKPGNFAEIMRRLRLPHNMEGSTTTFDRSFLKKALNCVGNACRRLTPTQRGLAAAGTVAAAGVGAYLALRPPKEKLEGGRRRSHRRKHRNNRKTRHRNKRRV